MSTRLLPQYYLCVSERDKIHDGRDKVSLQLSSRYLQLTTGIIDDARIPSTVTSSEGMIIEREKHRAIVYSQ